ncbi:MAG: alpha/beta fold hydrolase [Pirellulaceae bacterium]
MRHVAVDAIRFLWLLIVLLPSNPLFANNADGSAVEPLARAHAHNDYMHPRPLHDALALGFCSVEADVFLVDGELLVAHSSSELTSERTLVDLYLQPLHDRVSEKGSVYGDGQSLTLLIDIKAQGRAAYEVLDSLLTQYPGTFTWVETTPDGKTIVHPAPVQVIVSGDRPLDEIAADRTRYVGIDGRLGDIDSDQPTHLLPLISDNWSQDFRWRGIGEIPTEELKKLNDIVARVHAHGRRLRFWGIPDNVAGWHVLQDAGVDFINTDQLKELAEFLRATEQPASPQPTELWYGVLDAKVRKFRFVLELNRVAESWQGQLLSLDEGGRRFPLDELVRNQDSLSFQIKSSAGSYSSTLNEASSVADGKWLQRGAELELRFELVPAVPQEKLAALWIGEMNVLIQKLTMVFRELENGEIYFDSASQKVGGFVASKNVQGDEVEFSVPALKATFKGQISPDGAELKGTWKQGLLPVPLTLKKSTAGEIDVAPIRRPQTPQPPFPYNIEEVKVENSVADRIQLAGTLTVPPGNARVPAVVLISGSGPQDRDESIADHKPFRVIADHLTRRGIAVLRFDDRGVGESQGQFATATSEDFASDVAACVGFLRADQRIDAGKIGLIGHSEGGLIAPLVAAQDNEIAFAVLLAGTGVNGDKILRRQMRMIMEAEAVAEDEIVRQLQIQSIFLDLAKQRPPLNKDEFIAAAERDVAAFLTKAEKDSGTDKVMIDAAADQVLSPWFRFFLTYEPASTLEKLSCPLLAIGGSRDVQVDAKQNLPVIAAALERSKSTNFKTVELPGHNHLLQECSTGSLKEYQQIEQTISPQVLQLLAEWILQVTAP